MKRLILQMQMSVDGFVHGDDPSLDWTLWSWGETCPWDAALKQRFNKTLADIDTVLLSGPMAANGYIEHWTRMFELRAGDPDFYFTERIVSAHKRVISRSVDAIQQPRTSMGRGSLSEELAALKQGEGGDIICFGGVSFAAALLAADLVDELQLYVNPSVIAAGTSIFQEARRMRCIDATNYDCGIVVQRYVPGSRQVVASQSAQHTTICPHAKRSKENQ